MAVKKRRISTNKKGAGKPAPSTSGGGIIRRTTVPDDPEIPLFSGELGQIVAKMTASGDYGKPFIRASSRRMDKARTRTGILALDLALGGGWTLSSTGMLYGEKSSGKSTTALQSIARIHQTDPDAIAGYVDIEGTCDKAWARKLGVDLERLLIVEPETGEHAVDLTAALLNAREVRIVVTDSIAMLVPMKEIDESAEQETMALQARLMGKYFRKTSNIILRERSRGHQPLLLNINQFRSKVGLIFGDPRTLPGGKAQEYATTQQVETKNKEIKGKDSDGNEVVIYNEHNAKITKNKGGGPIKEAAFKLIRVNGQDDLPEGWIDQAKTIYKFGTQCGVISGAPSSFDVDGYGKFRGAPAFNAWALENLVAYHKVQDMVIEGMRKKWDL